MGGGEPQQSQPFSFGATELRIERTRFPPGWKPGTEGQGINQTDPTDSMYIQHVQGFISGITSELGDLEKILGDIRTKANGAFGMEMPISAKLVIDSTKSGKREKPIKQQHVRDYYMELTWEDDSDSGHKRHKEIPSPPETKWKISIKPPVADVPNDVKKRTTMAKRKDVSGEIN